MRAVKVHQFGGPDVLRVEQAEVPAPIPGQTLVRIRATGLNPVETYIRSGLGVHPVLPYTPGTDAAGEIAALGDDSPAFEAGQRVCLFGSLTGTYAEFTLCAPEHLLPLPDDLGFEQGAAVGTPYVTAYRALFQRGRGAAGETVLVHGASGGVGLAAVQLALAAGLRVVGTAGDGKGRRLVRNLGVDLVLTHEETGRVVEWTEGRGVDLIVEMRSDLNLGEDLALLAPRGRVVCVGNRGPANEGTVTVNARDLMRREGDILGLMLPAAGKRELADAQAALGDLMAAGVVRPIVSRRYALEQAAEAHRDLESGHTHGKIVLVP